MLATGTTTATGIARAILQGKGIGDDPESDMLAVAGNVGRRGMQRRLLHELISKETHISPAVCIVVLPRCRGWARNEVPPFWEGGAFMHRTMFIIDVSEDSTEMVMSRVSHAVVVRDTLTGEVDRGH
jgi:hypothetical protein